MSPLDMLETPVVATILPSLSDWVLSFFWVSVLVLPYVLWREQSFRQRRARRDNLWDYYR